MTDSSPCIPDDSAIWLFGYGSLIWRPDFDYLERQPASVSGWQRRFWQGSHDHRGTPDAPGRVVTLVPAHGQRCTGMAFRIASAVASEILPALDHREKNGYQRIELDLELHDGRHAAALTWIAIADNHAWLGPADMHELAAHIQRSRGPSGGNPEYVLALAAALREMGAVDEHVFELERALLSLA